MLTTMEAATRTLLVPIYLEVPPVNAMIIMQATDLNAVSGLCLLSILACSKFLRHW